MVRYTYVISLGSHELQLFADAKLMLVASNDKIMWAPFKFEEAKESTAEEDSTFPRKPSEEQASIDFSQ